MIHKFSISVANRTLITLFVTTPDERKAERQQLRCNAKRKASEDATARPSKIIGKQLQTMSKTNLKQDDIKNVSKAIDRIFTMFKS
jgi:hypothetical protein